jgi:fibronectin-binding autotransporter adhesin
MGKRSGSGNIGQSVGASGIRNGVFTGVGVRPLGYKFPIGLNGANNGVTVVDTITTTPAPGTYSFPGTAVIGSSAEVLIVAGGGAGGTILGGGGGGGGLVYHSAYPVSTSPISIGIGAGGVLYPPSSPLGPTKGSDTTFGIYTAKGGGAGRSGQGGGGADNGPSLPGGSSGGGSYYIGPTGGAVPATQPGQSSPGATNYGSAGAGGSGFNPANPTGNYSLGGGGGGGAGGAAWVHPLSAPDVPYRTGNLGQGGAGFISSITGTSLNYSSGGVGQHQQPGGGPGSPGPTKSYGAGGDANNGGGGNGAVITKYFINDYNIN